MIRTCLEKREMEGDPGDYILVQILRDGSKSSLTFVVFLFSNYDDDYFF